MLYAEQGIVHPKTHAQETNNNKSINAIALKKNNPGPLVWSEFSVSRHALSSLIYLMAPLFQIAVNLFKKPSKNKSRNIKTVAIKYI